MDPFHLHDLNRLIELETQPQVSMLMPTHRTGKEIRQDPIRCKNLVTQAAKQLEQSKMRTSDIRALLAEASELPDDLSYWRYQSDGLAVFLAPGHFFSYRVPLAFDELVTVGNRFQVRAMLPLLQGDGQFYILAASQNSIRLFQGSKFDVLELEPEALPGDLRSALNIDEYQQSLQFHTFSTKEGAGSGTGAMFHGQGGSGKEVEKKDELKQFCQRLDHALQSYLGPEGPPLVFAGVENLFPIFQEANHYQNLVHEPVTGNFDEASAKELHEKVWKCVAPRFEKPCKEALAQCEQLLHTPTGTGDLNKILTAAEQGGVETLFLPRGTCVWGKKAPDSGQVTTHPERLEEDEDLGNLAAINVLKNGGTVFVIESDAMPAGSQLAATLRYPVP